MDYYERTFYKKISKRQDDMFRQMCINYLFSQFIFVFLSPHIDHSSYYVLIKMFLKIKKIFLREFLLCKLLQLYRSTIVDFYQFPFLLPYSTPTLQATKTSACPAASILPAAVFIPSKETPSKTRNCFA